MSDNLFNPGDDVETPSGKGVVIMMTYWEPYGAIHRDMDAVMVRHKKGTEIKGKAQVWYQGSKVSAMYRLEDVQPSQGLGI